MTLTDIFKWISIKEIKIFLSFENVDCKMAAIFQALMIIIYPGIDDRIRFHSTGSSHGLDNDLVLNQSMTLTVTCTYRLKNSISFSSAAISREISSTMMDNFVRLPKTYPNAFIAKGKRNCTQYWYCLWCGNFECYDIYKYIFGCRFCI